MIRWTGLVGAAASVILTLAACSSASSPTTVKVVGGAAGVRLPDTPLATPYVFNVQTLCLTKGTRATPTGIVLVNPVGQMKIVDWGVRDRTTGDNYTGIAEPDTARGTVSSLPDFTHAPITTRCSATKSFVQLDVSVQLVSSKASSDAFTLTYKVGGQSKSVQVPYSVMLCRQTCPKYPTPLNN